MFTELLARVIAVCLLALSIVFRLPLWVLHLPLRTARFTSRQALAFALSVSRVWGLVRQDHLARSQALPLQGPYINLRRFLALLFNLLLPHGHQNGKPCAAIPNLPENDDDDEEVLPPDGE